MKSEMRFRNILVHIINNLNINSIMDKKVFKMYESPAVEIVELNVEGQLLAGSPTGGGSEGFDEDDIDPGFGG